MQTEGPVIANGEKIHEAPKFEDEVGAEVQVKQKGLSPE